MISSNIFGRIVKCHIALPCQWKRECIRTFSCTGFVSKEHNEHDAENTVDKNSKQDEELKMRDMKRVKPKIAEKPDYMKTLPKHVQEHILRIMKTQENKPPKDTKKEPLRDLETPKIRNTKLAYKRIQNHIKKIQEIGETPKESRRIENEPRTIQAKKEVVQESMAIQVQRMQSHIQRIQNLTADKESSTEAKPRFDPKQRGTREERPPSKREPAHKVDPEALEEVLAVLNNFKSSSDKSSRSHSDPNKISMETWNTLIGNDLKSRGTYYPRSPFEEMIMWTEKGTMWKFPVNNEEGMVEEENVHFSEHIFLDQHLEEWCPTVGPIRHFMELVCIGLSKNPYFTVEEKVAHIMWYKKYFTDQVALLEKLGAWGSNPVPQIEEPQSEGKQQQQSV